MTSPVKGARVMRLQNYIWVTFSGYCSLLRWLAKEPRCSVIMPSGEKRADEYLALYRWRWIQHLATRE